jgi:hypothetical protein
VKTSVFDLPQFKGGPSRKNACSVIALESSAGEWVGVLRMMDDEQLCPGREVELIAISRGEASYADVVCAFEERVDFLHNFEFKDGHEELMWKATNRTGTNQGRPQDLVDAFKRSRTSRFGAQLEGKYKFYNVMCIEWEGEKACRRAVGRVRKEAWERHCSEPIKVILA